MNSGLAYPWDLLRQLPERGREVMRRLRQPLAPRLGVLRQHAPRPLRLPRPFSHPLPRPAPLISIVTPSFNQGRFLERTMRSVLDQRYPRLEYIVQDGGSTDETPAVLERLRGGLAHCESCRDAGQADALNRGFRHATGDILAYLNSDDLLLPDALAFVADYFERHPRVDVLYGHRVVIDEEDQEIGRWTMPAHDDEVLSWCDYVPQETLFWRRSLWNRVGAALDASFQYALDWDLLLRFRDAGACFARAPRFLGAFRVHAEQKTTAWLTDVGLAEQQRLRRRCHGRDVTDDEIRQHVRPYLRKHVVHQLLGRMGLA